MQLKKAFNQALLVISMASAGAGLYRIAAGNLAQADFAPAARACMQQDGDCSRDQVKALSGYSRALANEAGGWDWVMAGIVLSGARRFNR